ncbi:MAG TPA: hypothetical protein VHK64_05475, partial [Nocardioidaceae bacterium]|nr:hypothetical protein [Nocardioidaceae bacterium]
TGSPWFDERFEVFGAPQALPVPALPLIAARDDWVLVAEGYTVACIRKDPYASVDDVTGLVRAVLDIVATIPASAARVDRSVDDLVAQIRALDGPEDALAFLQRLSDGDRERLARSNTPLAPLADVRTPEEAMMRLQLLPPDQQSQLMAMFFRVGDGR